MFYSSGWYSEPYYNVRVAKSKSPTGPFIKKKFPILETNWIPFNKVICLLLCTLLFNMDRILIIIFTQGFNTTFVGPGHCSVVDVSGDWWMIYHSWIYGKVNVQPPGRVVMMDRISWNRGWPVIGSPSTKYQQGPL